MFLRVETKWPCVAPHGQQNCPGALIVISDGDTHSIACGKCNLGTVGAGPLPEFWVTKLIEQGYLRQLSRIPADKKAVSDILSAWWNRQGHPLLNPSRGEMLDVIFTYFEVFHKDIA